MAQTLLFRSKLGFWHSKLTRLNNLIFVNGKTVNFGIRRLKWDSKASKVTITDN